MPGTTFEDLQAGLGYLRRKVDGENESQLSFIKANISSIMDQMDTLKGRSQGRGPFRKASSACSTRASLTGVKKRFEIDTEQFGKNPTYRVEKAISSAKQEADRMFFDVLGRKDSADATRNAINVLNRFRFLFNLPANIEANLAKGDFDRIIDEYDGNPKRTSKYGTFFFFFFANKGTQEPNLYTARASRRYFGCTWTRSRRASPNLKPG